MHITGLVRNTVCPRAYNVFVSPLRSSHRPRRGRAVAPGRRSYREKRLFNREFAAHRSEPNRLLSGSPVFVGAAFGRDSVSSDSTGARAAPTC